MFVWVPKNNQMEWSDKQRSLGGISCRQERINLPKGEERQSNSPDKSTEKRKKERELFFRREVWQHNVAFRLLRDDPAEWAVLL